MLSLIVIWRWCLCFRIALYAKPSLASDNSYYLREERVMEELKKFMNVPRAAMEIFDSFYYKGGFPNNLQAPDRYYSLQFIHSLIDVTEQVIFYGLEDGTFLGYLDSDKPGLLQLEYREPGEDGYSLSLNNNETSEMEMSIHYNTCVDSETGKEQNCTLAPGDKYISCIDGCNLTRCDNEESQIINCTLPESKSSVSECGSQIKWCKSYETKETVAMDKGYIPTTHHCFNSFGSITEKSGEVINVDDDGKEVFGDCKFGSGYLVHRNLTGPFAQCQPSKECNTTFMGGYSNKNYDPRYRGWYKSAKKRQKPGYSDVYAYSNADLIGMTYFHPIYSYDGNKKIFYGVLAADLKLDVISKYMLEITNYTDESYGVIEDKPPYNMIAISTGTSLSHKICSDNQECVISPLSINDLGNDGMEDRMLQKAHKELSIGGFVPNQVITFLKEDDKPDSLMATSQIFDQPEYDLRWRIVKVWPLLENRNGEIKMRKYLYGIIMGVALVGFLSCSALFVFNNRRRPDASTN